MYLPRHFEESRPEVLRGLMRAHPLATVVTLGADGPQANHVPLLLGEDGVLRGHVARANPMLADRVEGAQALAIFHGPHSYISPSWYPTKREHGRVVPTWNYAVVHAYGALRVIDDAQWLRDLLRALVAQHEAGLEQPWSMDDAPADYLSQMVASVIGFEIVVSRLIGKWKVSQNQPAANRAAAAAALRRRDPQDFPLAAGMAALIEDAAK